MVYGLFFKHFFFFFFAFLSLAFICSQWWVSDTETEHKISIQLTVILVWIDSYDDNLAYERRIIIILYLALDVHYLTPVPMAAFTAIIITIME